MKMKKSVRTSLLIIGLASIGALLYSGFAPLSEAYVLRQVQSALLILPVQPIQQKRITSCGEAAIAMSYNYAYPNNPIRESDVIAYATQMGYFTADRPPFTGPTNMVKITENYTDEVTSGRAVTQQQGLLLLFQKLQNNEPIIIDVLTRLNDPTSGAHFVVVTGMSIDQSHEDAIIIHYNNPLTARSEAAPWSGTEGIWNAWQNNGDPGGAGWWMTIRAP
jgi:hypothetical protein